VKLGGAIELHAAFREEKLHMMHSVSATPRKYWEATWPYVVFS
jgi:hypothetical protein